MARGRWRAISGAEGYTVGRKRVRRLMPKMGLARIYQPPRTTVPHPEHRIYPYLLRDLMIDRPNQVWCADLTYIPMRRGFLYLVAVTSTTPGIWPSDHEAVQNGHLGDGHKRQR
jgi:transposase InsO family protein